MTSLGTDGFGRSEGRAALRDFFEVDAKHIVLATLGDLARDGKIEASVVQKAIKDLGHQPGETKPGDLVGSSALRVRGSSQDPARNSGRVRRRRTRPRAAD